MALDELDYAITVPGYNVPKVLLVVGFLCPVGEQRN